MFRPVFAPLATFVRQLVRQQGDRCFGKQVKSTVKTRPSSAFAKASRWGEYERALARQYTPGPGAYDKVF